MKKFLFILILFSSCYVSDDLRPDQDIWEYDLPKNHRFDQNLLLLINSRLREQDESFGSIEGLTIIKDNKLIFENYYLNEANRQYVKNVGRTGMVITLAALGIAIDQRLLSVEDSIFRHLPEYSAVFQSDPDKKNIRILDLLTHRTGLEWNENIERDPTKNNFFQMKLSNDWIEFALSQTLVGVGFYSYSTANGVILAKILENVTEIDFNTFVQEEIFKPLNISHASIDQDAQGNFNGGDGYNLMLLDYAKIGYLYLNEGIWKGRTLVNTNFMKDALTRQHQFSTTQINNSVGYFWTFFGEDLQNLGVEHRNVAFFIGQQGQSIFIVPEEDMIIAILSDNPFGFNFQPINLFFEITRATTPI